MPTRLLDPRATPTTPTSPPPTRPTSVADPGYEALSRLTRLQAILAAAVPARSRSRWKEPPLFFLDRRRQAQLKAIRPGEPPNPFADVSSLISAELPRLASSVEVRRVARAVPGLRTAAEALAAVCPEAKDLADLLAIPDDEVVLVLHPALRVGFRLTVRGVVDVGQFHVLMAAATTGDPDLGLLPGPSMPERFVSAYQNDGPAIPAGIPMMVEARFQLYSPAAIQPDGTLPAGFGGCDHWLWPTTSLAAIPRVDGERMVLIGPPAYRATWEVGLRFPGTLASVQVVEALGPFLVAGHLRQLTGQPIPPVPRIEQERVLSRAA